MEINIHPHAKERLKERGASVEEIEITIRKGEQFQAKYGRKGFRHNFIFENNWRGKKYNTKQIEAYAVWENDAWLVVSLITKFF